MMKSSVKSGHLLTAAALAIVLMLPCTPLAAAEAMPAERVAGDVSYVSGGIGDDEIAAMKAAAARYPLELVFVGKDGSYLAGNPVVIRDASGQVVLDTQSEGPFLLARLPPGRYAVKAIYMDQTREQRVNIGADGHARAVFAW